MRTTARLVLVLSCVLVFGLLASPVRAEDVPAAPAAAAPVECHSVVVLVEAWRVTHADLVGQVDAITELRPGSASEVRALLREQATRAVRLARFLVVTAPSEALTLEEVRKTPLTVTAPMARGGATVGGFGGFVESGAQLQLVQHPVGQGLTRISIDMSISGTTGTADAAGIPPGQGTTRLKATLTAAHGAWSMFASNAAADDMVLVFVRASVPGEEPARVIPPAAPTKEIGDLEIERFKALKSLVEKAEREERYAQMIGHQLDRLEIELTDAQRAEIVAAAAAFRTAVRERLQTLAANQASPEEREAAMELLSADFGAKIGALLDEEAAQKVVEALGRYPGGGSGGRRRMR